MICEDNTRCLYRSFVSAIHKIKNIHEQKKGKIRQKRKVFKSFLKVCKFSVGRIWLFYFTIILFYCRHKVIENILVFPCNYGLAACKVRYMFTFTQYRPRIQTLPSVCEWFKSKNSSNLAPFGYLTVCWNLTPSFYPCVFIYFIPLYL